MRRSIAATPAAPCFPSTAPSSGVTSAIFSPSGGSVGLGFAIPAETVTAVIGQLQAHGRVERGYLGISAQAMSPVLAKALGMKKSAGALVTRGGCTGTCGRGVDGGRRVAQDRSEYRHLQRNEQDHDSPGAPGTGGGEGISRRFRAIRALTIGRLPDPPTDPALTGDLDTWVPALRLGVANSTADIRKTIKAADDPSGLIITQLRPTGPGALAGLKVGDLITHAAGKQLLDCCRSCDGRTADPRGASSAAGGPRRQPEFCRRPGEAELQFPDPAVPARYASRMLRLIQIAPPLLLLVIATTLEVSGDAVLRMGLYNNYAGTLRVFLFLGAATLLFGYGLFLNLAPLEFGRVVGLYIATLFVVWQIINYVAFRTLPNLPILVGGAFVLTGGAIITFWKPL